MALALIKKRPLPTNNGKNVLPSRLTNETLVVTSFTKLIYPPKPSCGTPWIVSSVEIRGETRLFDPFSGHALPNVPHHVFEHQFNIHYLAEHYHMAHVKGNDFPKSLSKHDKVLLIDFVGDQSMPLMINDCSLLVLSNGGRLTGFPPVEFGGDQKQSMSMSYGSIDTFDDILRFKGITYVLDRLGMLYQMSPDTFGELEIIVDEPIVKAYGAINIWRKRLVGSPWDEEVYLVVRDDLEDVLDVYKLSQSHTKRSWIKVQAFVGKQVLVLSCVHGFFAPASEFVDCMSLQNCIFFHDAFTRRLNIRGRPSKKRKVENEMQVFWLGVDNQNFKPISSYPLSPAMNLFSLPKWFVRARTFTCRSYCKSEPEEDVLMEPTPSCYDSASPGSGAMNRNEEEEGVYHANSTPETPKKLLTCSIVEFEGIQIKSEFLPTLQTIWDRHGSLIGEINVCSKDMRTCALESLAKLVITLEKTTGRSLTDSLAEDIESTLYDLQHVGLKVDWLVPIVEKTLKLLRSKPLIKSIMLLDEKKAQVEKEEKEFLARTTREKQQIEEEMACLYAMIPYQELIDLDDCLGGGLL